MIIKLKKNINFFFYKNKIYFLKKNTKYIKIKSYRVSYYFPKNDKNYYYIIINTPKKKEIIKNCFNKIDISKTYYTKVYFASIGFKIIKIQENFYKFYIGKSHYMYMYIPNSIEVTIINNEQVLFIQTKYSFIFAEFKKLIIKMIRNYQIIREKNKLSFYNKK